MKYGVHSYVYFKKWHDVTPDFMQHLRSLDVDCLEIGVGNDVEFDTTRIRQEAEEAGLELSFSPGDEWPMDCDTSSEDPAERKKGLDYHKQWIDLAAEVGGVAYAGALYGHPGLIKRRRPPEDELPRIAEEMHKLGAYAEERGVKILLEPMSHFRTHIVNRPEQLLKLLELADQPNLYALLDTYHMVTEVRDYGAAIRMLKDHLYGIHACENDRGRPRPDGLIPWDEVFEALLDIKFDGLVLLESYNSSLGDFAFERGMFHNVCPDPDEFVSEGLGFVRQGLTRAQLAIGK
jgi:D-psicose/D-tagatose/L-ribulose 3-epimerase